MILIPSSLLSLLSQLTTPQGVPHTAILTSSSSGSIISSHSVPVQDPLFPKATYQDDEGLADEERVGMYAALAVGTWNEQRGTGTSTGRDPLMLETEVSLNSFPLLFEARTHLSIM